ncbi:MAG: Long-chain-fatty-acid--CoA ligase [Phycisphaerae bacterium]|nr:Long-chain-fatty-acid--CoA ligase [Phycisphaerae bacterium]
MHPLLDAFERAWAENSRAGIAADAAVSWTCDEFRGRACGLAATLAAVDACPRIGILAPTSAATAAAIVAAWYAGRIPVPLNYLLPPDELRRVVADAQLETILAADVFAPSAAGLPVRVIPLRPDQIRPRDGSAPVARPDDLAVILYTSGTSGDPKGVCLTFSNLVSNARASVAHIGLRHEHTFVSVLPQFHSFGLTTLTVLPLLLAAPVHYLPRFNAAAIAETIRQNRASVFLAVASMFGALTQLKSANAAALDSLEFAISGGEPLPAQVAEGFAHRFGKRILEGYGLTEASPVVSVNTPAAFKAGSVGRPIPGVAVRVVGEDGTRLPPDAEGELVVEGHCVMKGYYQRPAETAAVMLGEALRTGDVGRVDADSFVHITGRAKDLIIVGGENVYPREIERVLDAHPAVAESAVVGVRDALRGELPVAFVRLREGQAVSERELRAHCRTVLAGFKVPRRINFVSEFPRGPTGKVLKRALREQQ